MKKTGILFLSIACLLMLSACKKEVYFPALEVEVTADAGLEMSLDENNYFPTLTNQSIISFLSEKYETFTYEQLTSIDGIHFTSVDQITPVIDQGYIEFPIYFRSNTIEHVFWNHVVLASELSTFVSDVAFESHAGAVDVGDEITFSAANAFRVSIEGMVDEEEHVVVYEMPAQYNYNTVLNTGGDMTGSGEGVPGMYHYYYKKMTSLIPGSDQVVTAPSVTQVSNLKLTDLLFSTDENKFIGSITIRIWIEGWDPDAYGFISSTPISLVLSFNG